MGLGKTAQTVAYVAALETAGWRPALVIAPLSTLAHWEREFATWAPQLNVVVFIGNPEGRDVIRRVRPLCVAVLLPTGCLSVDSALHAIVFSFPQSSVLTLLPLQYELDGGPGNQEPRFDVVVTSYEIAIVEAFALRKFRWAAMVVDEGQRLKNRDSKLFTKIKDVRADHRLLLSGTPLQNNLGELFNLLEFMLLPQFKGKDREQIQAVRIPSPNSGFTASQLFFGSFE